MLEFVAPDGCRISKEILLSENFFVLVGQSVHSGKFKNLKHSENVEFAGTNNIDSIYSFKVSEKKLDCNV